MCRESRGGTEMGGRGRSIRKGSRGFVEAGREEMVESISKRFYHCRSDGDKGLFFRSLFRVLQKERGLGEEERR